MHFCRGAQDWLDQRPGHSRQGLEAASEFMADQKSDGDVLDALWKKKEPDPGVSVSVASGGAPERNRAQTIRDVLQIRIRAQPVGSYRLAL